MARKPAPEPVFRPRPTADVSQFYSPTLSAHGGGCCGISHIHGFGGSGAISKRNGSSGPKNADEAEARIRFLISKYWKDTGRRLDDKKSRLYEIVLKTSQCKQWQPIIERIGFVKVTDFLNTNSNNRCHVFHLAIGPTNMGPYISPYREEPEGPVPDPFKPKPATDLDY